MIDILRFLLGSIIELELKKTSPNLFNYILNLFLSFLWNNRTHKFPRIYELNKSEYKTRVVFHTNNYRIVITIYII